MTKQKKKRSPALRRVGGVIGTFFRVLASIFLVCVITGCIVGCALAVYILDYVGTIEDIDIKQIDMNYTSIIYANDKEGNPVELSRIHGKENRIWVDREEMPEYLFDVTIATEDKRFNEHRGVDWVRTIGSTVNFFIPIYNGRQSGGSTITQQLIKNATDQWDATVERKVKEIFSALKLEQEYEKLDILEAYLNVAAFGNNTNGVEAAANLYFNKHVSELTLVECAAIVATTQYPTYYDLFRYPEHNKERRNDYIFPTMLEQGMLTQAEYDQAIATDVVVQRSQAPAQQPNSTNTWFEDMAITEVIDDLVEQKGMSYTDARGLAYRGGLRIYTTVDPDMQKYLEEKFTDLDTSDGHTFPPIRNAIYPESAFIVMDPHGRIKAVAGSNRPKQGNLWLSYATDTPHQPGSTIKPLAAYLQGIESNLINWSTIMEDSPIPKPGSDGTVDPNNPWPQNYYSYYDGNHTMVFALQRSINTIPVKIMNFIGPEKVLYYLHDQLMMKNLVTPEENAETNDAGLSAMALGGATYGVTLRELAGAYQIYANGGSYTDTTSYYAVRDSNNNILLEADTAAKRVLSKETASIVNLMMRQVVDAYPGSGRAAKFKGDLAAMPIAGKTGTSQDNKDQWFVGITPYYTGVVWMGYAPVAQPINYINFPTPIVWHNVMQPIHEGLEIKDFEYSQNITQKEYCANSGLLSTPECPNRMMGWYKVSSIPDSCTEHTGVQDSQETDEKSDREGDESSSSRPSHKVNRSE